MTRLLFLLFILAAAVFPGCQEKPAEHPPTQPARPRPNLAQWQAAFNQADKIELLSILPKHQKLFDHLPKFDGYPVVDTATISDANEKDQLYQLLEALIYDQMPGERELHLECKFAPHHAISITKNNEIHRIVICFACEQVLANSKTLPNQKITFLSHLANQERELDAILKAHGIERGYDYEIRKRKEEREKNSMP